MQTRGPEDEEEIDRLLRELGLELPGVEDDGADDARLPGWDGLDEEGWG